MTALLEVPPAAGSFDVLTVADGRLSVQGWMFQPGHALDRLEAHLDGRSIGLVPLVDRADVAGAFAWAEDARPACFALSIELEGRAATRVDVIGRAGATAAARLSCLVPTPADASVPDPPDELQERVAALHGPVFRAQGLRMFTDLVDQLRRCGAPTPKRMLDWGCGCGRVARHFLARLPDVTLVGCDLDAGALAWCRRHVGGEFVEVGTMPPTPFRDADFDLVIACSVLTHLAADVQETWLAEIRRVLAPGGWFLASTQGEYAFRLAHPAKRAGRAGALLRRITGAGEASPRLTGVDDAACDPALDGIAPAGYYRGVFQSRAHTIAVCRRHFEVVDYVERGLNGHQDLVVLRRAA